MTTDTHGRTNHTKINEALEILNEAAKEKRGELEGLMANKYGHIREAMSESVDQAREFAQQALIDGKEKVKAVALDVDQRVHKDPWVYIAGATAAALLVGYLLGSKRK